MKRIMTVHYVPKPSGGVAVPGEILDPAVAAKFTDEQIARLLRIGAIMIEETPESLEAAQIDGGIPERLDDDNPGQGEDDDLEQSESYEPEPEPPEIDTLDGIVRADESHDNSTKKTKANAQRAGRRKTK